MQSKGYLMVDHRASPGIPEEVALAMGLDPKLVGKGCLFEGDTMACVHCKNVTVKNHERTRERYSCQQCAGGYICDKCKAETLSPGYFHLDYNQKVESARELADRFDYTGSSLILT